MPKHVQLPDGSVGEFPDAMQDSEIEDVLRKQYGSPSSAPSAPQSQTSWLPSGFNWRHPLQNIQSNLPTAVDVAKGAGKGLVNTLAGVGDIRNAIPTPIRMLAGDINPAQINTAPLHTMATPHNAAQSAGRAVEQAGEFMALPEVGAASVPLRIAGTVAATGALNKAQGGTFTGGALAGGIGGSVAEGLRAVAPAIAESAMGTRRVERGFGKNPGQAILDDTTGVRPETINSTAKAKIAQLGSANDAMATAYPNTVSIQPGIDVVDQNIGKGIGQNSKGVSIPQMEKVRLNMTESPPISGATGQFTTPSDPAALPGLSLSPDQTAIGAQNIKRGLRTDYISNFDPVMMKGTRSVANQAAGAIDSSLDAALGPEYAANNARMSGLFSVTDAMKRRALDPSLGQKLAAKGAAHTGALFGAGAGASVGYREGGVPGAVLGGIAGFAGPELLLSPEAQMLAARSMYSPTVNTIARPAVTGAGLQFLRSPQP